MIYEPPEKIFEENFNSSISVKKLSFEKLKKVVTEAATTALKTFKNNRKMFVCGNGGSAADSQHFAGEFIGKYLFERKSLPAIALTTNTSNLTAIGNDYGYETTFKRQLEGLGSKGDLLFCISTSGNSQNVIEAAKTAKKIGITTISMTGDTGGKLKKYCDINITVPSTSTPRIQETHILIIHTICDFVEINLFPRIKKS